MVELSSVSRAPRMTEDVSNVLKYIVIVFFFTETKMSFKFLVVGVLGVFACYVNGQSCNSGSCISIFDCPDLLDLLNKKNRSPQEVELLQKSKCGFENTTPKVCCPDPCYNPDGKPGKCINIYQCPHLANMLKPPISRPDNTNYVLNSKCTGPDRYSVCCGPPRIVQKNLNTKCTGLLTAFPPDPDSQCCGRDAKVGNKITGGNVTSVDQFPWLILIEYTKDNGPIKTLCGGALISGRYVLTAAHCVTGAILSYGIPRNVRLGEYDKSHAGSDCANIEAGGEDCNEGTVIIPIEESIPHPEYNTQAKQSRHDIALVRMKQSAPFTDFIRPICLPAVDATLNPPVNFTLFAAGWGAVSETQPSSDLKLFVDLPYVSRDTCQPMYNIPNVRKTVLWEGQMCAGGVTGKDSCRGDSGGPLMYENEKRLYEVIGLVSFGPTPCGLPDVPGVYTKVFVYNAWIRSLIRA